MRPRNEGGAEAPRGGGRDGGRVAWRSKRERKSKNERKRKEVPGKHLNLNFDLNFNLKRGKQ